MPTLRTLLLLGRVSNVPTVWSNCLAGWLLAGGGEGNRFAILCFAGTFLYIGGMYLNDAFDAQFDQQHRPERPIPSGAIRPEAVWAAGFCWLGAGLACSLLLGPMTTFLACLLAATILIYDAVHKIFAISPILMAICRCLLILLAASAGKDGVTGPSIWSALVMGAYIVGLSYVARKESTAAALRYWPCAVLAAPLVLAFIVNQGDQERRCLMLSLAVALWLLRCLWFTFWSPQRNIGRTVSGLLAGIPLIDLLSVWEGSVGTAVIFVGLFVLALLFQRFVPAT